MSLFRRLDTHHQRYLSVALLLCLSMGLSLWMLGRLEQMSLLAAAAGQKLNVLQAHAGYGSARLLAWSAIGAMLGGAVLLALWLHAELVRPVRAAAAMARRIAEGDLSGKIDAAATGETGAMLLAMQDMNHGLAGLIAKVRTGTERIATSAGQIAAGSLLSARSTEQPATLVQAGAALAQLGAGVTHTAQRAQQAGAVALAATGAAADGAGAAT
ncbi:MAG: hypothetical protein WKG03_20175, partial [Telluria sp.]